MFYAFSLKKILRFLYVILGVLIFIVIAIIVFLQIYPLNHIETVKKYAAKYELEPEFVMAVIKTESGFDENAVSPKGASGLMQIMKPTADWAAEKIEIQDYSYNRITEPEINIEIGCWYLRRLMNEHNSDLTLVIASYNAGSGNVSKWMNDARYSKTGENLDSIPFEETSKYVERVRINKRIYEYIFKILGGNYD